MLQVAVESCVKMHQWEVAVRLADSYKFPDIQSALGQYAKELLVSGKQLHAVELYRKANQHMDAARLLSTLGAEVAHARLNRGIYAWMVIVESIRGVQAL